MPDKQINISNNITKHILCTQCKFNMNFLFLHCEKMKELWRLFPDMRDYIKHIVTAGMTEMNMYEKYNI